MNPEPVVFLFIVIALVFLLPAIIRRQVRRLRRNRAYRELARQYAGQCRAGGLFRRPRVRFVYGETQVELRTRRKRRRRWREELLLVWHGAAREFVIHDRLHSSPPPGAARLDVQTSGDSRWDALFCVRGRQPEELRRLLSAGVRWQTRQLYESTAGAHLLIQCRRGQLLIGKSVRFRRFQDLEQFVRLGLAWYDQSQLTQSEGINFVGEDQAQILDRVVCKVCGELIEDEMVLCAKCRTPHHHDCWLYAGRCSVYACQETRYTLPTMATRTQPLRQEYEG